MTGPEEYMEEPSAEPEATFVPFPQLSGVNWPSYLLQVWLTLHQIGVPEKNLRFLPEVGHFALPEVVEEEPEEDWERHSAPMELRHPRGARYDPETGCATVYGVHPFTTRPRLKVNVRADRFWQESLNVNDAGEEKPLLVGRLAHFMEPLLAGLPVTPSGDITQTEPLFASVETDETAASENEGSRERAEKPLVGLTRQICARYPELMAVVPLEARNVLSAWTDYIQRALETSAPDTRRNWLHRAAQAIPEKADRAAIADAFDAQAGKVTLPSEKWSVPEAIEARSRLREWGHLLTLELPDERAAHLESLANSLNASEIAQQTALLQMLNVRLSQETSRERYRIVRELMEILTTEVFTSVAVLDCLWGIGWIHGRAEDFRLPIGKLPTPAVFLSFTGGISQRTLLLLLIQKWLQNEGFLGVVSRPMNADQARAADSLTEPRSRNSASNAQGVSEHTAWDAAPNEALSEMVDTDLLNAAERQELWSLVAWRRESPDPLLLLQTAAQRLIHPDVEVRWNHYEDVGGGFNTLFSQPGATAALGGMVQVHYPGVTIYMPLTEDGDAAAIAAKSRLALLLRLFLPVCLRADVVWKEGVARMGQGSYLQHPYQSGVKIGK